MILSLVSDSKEIICIGYFFSNVCDQIPVQMQFNGGNTYFGSQTDFMEYNLSWWERQLSTLNLNIIFKLNLDTILVKHRILLIRELIFTAKVWMPLFLPEDNLGKYGGYCGS